MDATTDLITSIIQEQPLLALSMPIFLATAMLAFGIMAALRSRNSIRRRITETARAHALPSDEGRRSLRHASRVAAKRLVDYTAKHYSGENAVQNRELRRQLIQAGFLDPRAVPMFFLARAAAAIAFAAAGSLLVMPLLIDDYGSSYWLGVMFVGILGYLAPGFLLKRRIRGRQLEHRTGFPDFMDLLVVCAEAGLSMEAALDRVGRELSDSYPSLSGNTYMTMLELRAGRTLGEALENLADRLGLDEARSFASLLQQSEELGSSLSDALRVYSDDMRHQRLSRAEEKAYSLPAKLSVPLTLCVFPVVIAVIMLPVYVRFKYGQ
jgi:tight adherence protein C